jgi:hypothetical protein
MKTRLFNLVTGLALTVCGSTTANLAAQGTAFTYQGRLVHGGGAASGLYEMSFALYDAVTNGSVVGTPQTIAPVPVSNGLFTATLDFGANAFTGASRWLEISVTVFGSDQPVVTLAPRQPITATPYALHAVNAAGMMSFNNAPLDIKVNGQRALRLEDNGDSATDFDFGPDGAPNLIGGSAGNYIPPGVVGATISGGGATNYHGFASTNAIMADYGVVGGGGANRIKPLSSSSTISGGYQNEIGTNASSCAIGGGNGNQIGNYSTYSTIAGGAANNIGAVSVLSAISGGANNRIEGNSSAASIAGGQVNNIGADSRSSTIAGGSYNRIADSCTHAVITGGGENSIGTNSNFSWIGGGMNNVIGNNSPNATIAGGIRNHVGISADTSTIGGGIFNAASAGVATVGGGYQNNAAGSYATIPGGRGNVANNYAFAAGFQARALHSGSFVWADASDADAFAPFVFSSIATNEFAVRATGGVRFVTAIDASGSNIAGVTLASGSGSWSSLSDRNAKENFAPADAREVLDKVAALPLTSWNYKAQGAGVRHLGPTAQDFHAAFGVGADDRHIATVDADGVALAAIQGLKEKVEARSARAEDCIQKLQEKLEQKETEITELKRRLQRLEQLIPSTDGGAK